MLQDLGARIKHERKSRGITQEKLAEMADISLNFMSLIENGKNMSVETLYKISLALGVTIDYLISDSESIQRDIISEQIDSSLSDLTNDEKLFFLNMIKQYKNLKYH